MGYTVELELTMELVLTYFFMLNMTSFLPSCKAIYRVPSRIWANEWKEP